MTIGQRIKELREERRVGLYQMSKALKIDHSNLSKWEAEKHTPNIFYCMKLADYFKITLDEFLRDVKEK